MPKSCSMGAKSKSNRRLKTAKSALAKWLTLPSLAPTRSQVSEKLFSFIISRNVR